MLGDIQVTLYDIFGYLLPGFAGLAALATLFWAVAAPDHAVTTPDWSGPAWLAVIVFAYLVGHVLQAAANLASWVRRGSERTEMSPKRISEVLCDIPDDHRKTLFRVCGTEARAKVFYFSDAAVTQKGKVADRDVFVYREGFYRGMVAAFLLGAIAILVRWTRGGASYLASGTTHAVPPEAFAFVLAALLLSAVLCYHRYQRFSRYRIAAAIWGLLVMLVLAPISAASDEEDP